MDTAPLVSIVIPAYNHGRYLDEAIRSVLGQDYARVELIVIDDGSTDGTRAVLEKYGKSFYWESQPNSGQSATLNKGWGFSRGELLGYLSADDALQPHAVSALVECLQARPEAVAAYADYSVINPDSQVVADMQAPEYSYFDLVVRMICAPGPGALFRRRAFEAAGGWDVSLRQIPDYEFWLRLALQGPFRRVPKSLALFRAHEESQSFGFSDERKAEEPCNVLAAYLARPGIPAEVARAKGQAMGQAYLLTSRLHVRSGRYVRGLVRFAQAVLRAPGLLLRKSTLQLAYDTLVARLYQRLAWGIRRRVDP